MKAKTSTLFSILTLAGATFLASGCSSKHTPTTTTPDGGTLSDAESDTGTTPEADSGTTDGGTGTATDSGAADSGSAQSTDSGTASDTGSDTDSGGNHATDSGAGDGGGADSGTTDSGNADSGTTDSGSTDNAYGPCSLGDVCSTSGFDCETSILPGVSFTGAFCTVTGGCTTDSDCVLTTATFDTTCVFATATPGATGQCFTTCATSGPSCPYGQACFSYTDPSTSAQDSLCTP